MKIDVKAVAATLDDITEYKQVRYAREMVMQEEQHLGAVDKMLRKPGDIGKAG